MYKNWNETDRIPKSMIVHNGWVIPEELESFMPPDEILDKLPTNNLVVYTFDGLGYDLSQHKFVDA